MENRRRVFVLGEAVVQSCQQLGQGPLGIYMAVAQQQQAIGNTRDLLHPVADKQHWQLAVAGDTREALQAVRRRFAVEVGQRFVQ